MSKDLRSILAQILREKVSKFLRIEIIAFRPGSIICIFDIVTEQDSTTSDEVIKDVLTKASENKEIGNYTFTVITVEKKVASEEPTTGDKEKTFPDWALGVIAVIGVVVLNAPITIYLVRKFYCITV